MVQKKAAQAAAMCDEKYAQLLGDIFVGNEVKGSSCNQEVWNEAKKKSSSLLP